VANVVSVASCDLGVWLLRLRRNILRPSSDNTSS